MLSYRNGPDNTAHVRAKCKDVITFLHFLLKLGLIRHVIQESYILLELGDHEEHFKLSVFKIGS